jgi:hypothetical protein
LCCFIAENSKSNEDAIREEGVELAKKVAKLEGVLKGVRVQLGEKTTGKK